jgi:hypothetical protein
MKEQKAEVRHFTPIGVTLETIDQLVREQEMDAVALYMAYCAVSQWQGTHQVKATNGFMTTRTGWTEKRFGKAKRVLISKGLVQNLRNLTDTGAIEGWYVKINHVVSSEVIVPDESTPPEIDCPGNRRDCEIDPPSAFNESKVLSTKESSFSANAEEKDFLSEAVEDVTFEVDEDFAPARSLRSRKPAPSTPLVSWAEQRRGRKFTTPIKQRSAILKLKESLDDEDIKALWMETENDEYWKERGLDFTILLSIADKKLTMGNRKDAEKDFKYHMSIMGKMMYDRKPRDEILAYREKHITPLKEKYGFK